MTGAGFGGCVLCLIKKDIVGDAIRETGEMYRKKFNRRCDFYLIESNYETERLS